MAKMWAKIVDDKLKLCDVGTGTDSSYYESLGYEKMEVALGIDGRYYLKGYEPGTPIPSYKQRRIAELKKLLAQYDYVGVKIATGCATIAEYKDIIDMCEGYRKEIRALQGDNNASS